MSEIKSTGSVSINNANMGKKRTTFAAVTPMQKRENEIRNEMAYKAGKYVIAESNTIGEANKISGILICLAKRGTYTAYCIMDKDRNIQFASILDYDLHTIDGTLPLEFSVLEYIRQREVDFLFDKVVDTLIKNNFEPATRITVNWKKQYGQRKENKNSPNNKGNQKKNNKK